MKRSAIKADSLALIQSGNKLSHLSLVSSENQSLPFSVESGSFEVKRQNRISTEPPYISSASGIINFPQRNFRSINFTQTSSNPVIERLKELSQLEEDWDSYGAKAVSSRTLVAAFEIINAIKDQSFNNYSLPEFIAPLVDGGLQLEWSGTNKDLEVEIDPSGDLNYVLIEKQVNGKKYQESQKVSLQEILGLLSNLLKN